MISPIHFGSRSIIPPWIIDIERYCFGDVWVSIGEDEHILAIPSFSFARWRVSECIQEAELLRIGVASQLRRTGYGRAILQYSQNRMAEIGITTLLLEVRASNMVARSLYESEGWSCLGLRRGYYRDGEDAMNYQRKISNVILSVSM